MVLFVKQHLTLPEAISIPYAIKWSGTKDKPLIVDIPTFDISSTHSKPTTATSSSSTSTVSIPFDAAEDFSHLSRDARLHKLAKLAAPTLPSEVNKLESKVTQNNTQMLN
jgi:hypothetical protein